MMLLFFQRKSDDSNDSVSPPGIHNLQVYPYSLEAVMAQETIGFCSLSQVEIPQHSLSQTIFLPSLPKYLFVWSHVRNSIPYMDLVPKMRHLFLLVAFFALGYKFNKSTLDCHLWVFSLGILPHQGSQGSLTSRSIVVPWQTCRPI